MRKFGRGKTAGTWPPGPLALSKTEKNPEGLGKTNSRNYLLPLRAGLDSAVRWSGSGF